MYDGRYQVISVDETIDLAVLEYRPGLPLVNLPRKYVCEHGAYALDPGDIIHLYPTDGNKLIILLPPDANDNGLSFEMDLSSGVVKLLPRR